MVKYVWKNTATARVVWRMGWPSRVALCASRCSWTHWPAHRDLSFCHGDLVIGLPPNSPSRLPKCRAPPSAGPPHRPLAAARRPPPAGRCKRCTQPLLAAGPSRAAGYSVNCCRSLKDRRSKEQATSKVCIRRSSIIRRFCIHSLLVCYYYSAPV